MKKTILISILSLISLLVSPVYGEQTLLQNPKAPGLSRGFFVSVIQDPPVLTSRYEIEKLVDMSRWGHVQVLFVQIYRANKAWFVSKVGDSTPYQDALKQVGEDPLNLLIKEAHASGIQVHAWINLLSLSTNEDAPLLKKYGPEILTKNLDEKKILQDYKIDNQYFLEPGDLRVRAELLTLLEEILNAYPSLDGVQFDYIRYPDTHPAYGYTRMNVERFKKSTGLSTVAEGSKVWKDWKRTQVTELTELLVKKTHELRPKIKVSTTGCMNYTRAYHEAFQDWAGWLKTGLVDFVTMMSYPKDVSEFEKNITEAKIKTGNDFSKVNIGIGAYKMLELPEIFDQEFKVCEKAGGRSCVVFHYGDLVTNPALARPLMDQSLGSK